MDKRTNEAQDSPGWVKVAAGSSSSRPQAEMDTRPRIDDHSISAPELEDQAITASDSTSRWLALPPEMKMAFYESLGRPKPLTKGLVQRTFTSADGREFCVTDTKCACPGAGMVVENAVPPKVMRISSTFWDRYDQECHCMLKKSTLHVYIRDKIPKSITDGPWNVKISDEEHLYDEPYDIQQLALKNFITVSGPQNDGDRKFSELLAPLGVNSLMEFCVMSARSGHTSWAWEEIGSKRAWKYYIDAPISYHSGTCFTQTTQVRSKSRSCNSSYMTRSSIIALRKLVVLFPALCPNPFVPNFSRTENLFKSCIHGTYKIIV